MIKLRGILDDQFNRYTAHLNLMICLLLLQVFFIIAILPVSLDSYILCKLTAICLHYFVITSFCWMFIDALDLVIVLTRGFYWYLPQKVVLILIGYGFPFLIVLVSSSFFWREYGMGIRKNICWINPGIFMIVSLGIPTFSMLLANMCFYAVVIHQMMVYSQGCKVSSNKSVRIWLRNAMSLFIMFGLTWISCFMFINRQATVFIYIFTLINSFIGVWLLIITAIMKPTIYNYIKRAIIDNISRLNERSERWSASNQSLFSYLRDYLGGKSTPLSNQRNSDSLNLMKEVRLANEVYRDEKTQYVTVQDNGSTIYFSVVNPQNS
ncbi:hypothetical protein GJ496_001940 [Pomphorhynchus laevis]|nr:hypothetical protein GJ496_001940 [Pomphorhynchus laevis]